MDLQKTGLFLKKLRTEKNLTQEQLAEKFNISRRSVSRWETGSNLPDIDIMIELADFYEIEIRELFNGERRSEHMQNEMKDTLLKAAEYSNEKKKKNIKLVTIFLIIGIVGIVVNQVLFYLNLPETFWTGLALGLSGGSGVGAIVVGLFFVASIWIELKEEKNRILEK